MGEEIIIEDIQFINGELFQIDFRKTESNELCRVFVEPHKLFEMIGNSLEGK